MTQGRLRHYVGAVLALVMLGAALGALWACTTPSALITITDDGEMLAAPAEMARIFGGAAYFSLLSFALGIACAVVIWFVCAPLRSWAGLVVAVGTALLAALIGMQVASAIAAARYPAIEVAVPGAHRLVQNLWLSDASLGGVSAPWLLLICAPGLAALTYLICAIAGGDEAFVTDGPPPVTAVGAA